MNIADQDQYAAAKAEAETIFDRMGPVLDARHRLRGSLAPFLDDFAKRHNAALAARQGKTCIHVALARAPLVLHMAVWYPGRMVCMGCAANGALKPDNHEENWTCDVCRRFLPGKISVSLAQTDHHLVWFAICRACGDALAEAVAQ